MLELIFMWFLLISIIFFYLFLYFVVWLMVPKVYLCKSYRVFSLQLMHIFSFSLHCLLRSMLLHQEQKFYLLCIHLCYVFMYRIYGIPYNGVYSCQVDRKYCLLNLPILHNFHLVSFSLSISKNDFLPSSC